MKERKCPGMTLQETAMRRDADLFGLSPVDEPGGARPSVRSVLGADETTN
jgi:hypothetical protein